MGVRHHYHAPDTPNVDLATPRNPEDDLRASVLVWLHIIVVKFVPKVRSPKVAQHWWANMLGLLNLPRDIDEASVDLFSRSGTVKFGLLELYKRGIVLEAKHDVVRFDVCVYDAAFIVKIVQGLEQTVKNNAEDRFRKPSHRVAGKERPDAFPERRVHETSVFAMRASELKVIQQ
jgi:hypothetical protein